MTQPNIITVKNEPYHYDNNFPLLSIHLASNRPDQFTQFVANVHETCANKNAYEIVVKIDTEDQAMIECLDRIVKQYGPQRVKPFVSPRKLGPWSTWESYNDMFSLSSPHVYFFWNPSDEVRFDTPGWDNVLATYIGFYDDHIFRMKLSDNRLRNFYALWEVLGSPDNFPFMTKKWMDICGLWGDCHSPDLFHQAVSFYLGEKNIFRDFPIFDIQLSGIEAGLLIPPAQSRSRTLNILRLWRRAMSNPIRKRYEMHAQKIKFYLESCQQGAHDIQFAEYIAEDHVVCSNNLERMKYIKCRDWKHFPDQVKFLLKDKIRFSRNACFRLISPITKSIKYVLKQYLGWYKLDIISSSNQAKKIQSVKKSHYILTKNHNAWDLVYFDKNKMECKIPLSAVKGLSKTLAVIPADKAPENYLRSEVAAITKTITFYHVSVRLGIKNSNLLRRLAPE